jgi:CRISPR/Cas system Type II protein with McrA/HNH and RuvC-like nuclease domain
MDNEIVSPTVRRSFNQACQIVNKIISIYCKKNKNKPNKKIYEINNITIELPRDKNINEERKKITKLQRENEAINKKAKSKCIPSE